jgi:hypothetical protein
MGETRWGGKSCRRKSTHFYIAENRRLVLPTRTRMAMPLKTTWTLLAAILSIQRCNVVRTIVE